MSLKSIIRDAPLIGPIARTGYQQATNVANRNFALRKLTLKNYPLLLCISIADVCNLKCPMCSLGSENINKPRNYQPRGLMSLESFKDVVDSIDKQGQKISVASMGEPLLNKNIINILEYIVRRGHVIGGFNSNFTLINESFLDGLREFRPTIPIIEASVDGFRESHERSRVGSSYETVHNNILRLHQVIKHNNLQIKLGVNATRTFQDFEELEEFARYWGREGVDSIVLQSSTIDNVDSVVGVTWNKKNLINSGLYPSRIPNRHPCPFLYNWMMVSSDKQVCYVCCRDWFGNTGVTFKGRVDTTWRSKEYQRLRYSNYKKPAGTICDCCEFQFGALSSRENRGVITFGKNKYTVTESFFQRIYLLESSSPP